MTTVFQELQDERFTRELESFLVPHMIQILSQRTAGHCMRVADLDADLMVSLAQALRRELPDIQVFILGPDNTSIYDNDLFISSTKLVELRNPLPDGTLRPPLLIFLPAYLHTSAEDSFSVATFEEIAVSYIYEELRQDLIKRLPRSVQGYVEEVLGELNRWPWANEIAQIRFLMTAIVNGVDGESLGAAIYELGLIPDFHLFADTTVATGRIRKNLETVKKITYSDVSVRGRVLELGITDKGVQRRLMQFLSDMGVEDPQAWTRHIVLERNYWDLSFDKWKFSEELSSDRVRVEVISTDLPEVTDDREEELQDLTGQQILMPKGQRKFNVVFRLTPHPTEIRGFDHLSVQIVAKDGGPVGVTKKVKAWKMKTLERTTALDKLDKVDFEEGWHIVRILPWTKDSEPIPMDARQSHTPSERPNAYESDPFYVLPDRTPKEVPPQRAIPRADSLEHARLRLQFVAIQERRSPDEICPGSVGWAEKSNSSRRTVQEMLAVRFEQHGMYHIPVAPPLKKLEHQILQSTEPPSSWRLLIHKGQVGDLQEESFDWPKSVAVQSFLSARTRYFGAILSGEKELVSQAVDFLKLKDTVTEYANTYHDLLLDIQKKIEHSAGIDQQHAIMLLRTVLAVDTVQVKIEDYRGKPREAMLVGPMHPLRALWLVTWTQIVHHWVDLTRNGTEEFTNSIRDGALQALVPLNIPATIPSSNGSVFTMVDNIHPFWSLYGPTTEQDIRALLGEVCSALNLSEPDIGGNTVTGEVLASRIERYIIQHPYIQTLSINAFNPGQATVLANALIHLQKNDTFANLRYDIRCFVPDPEVPGVGEAIERLLVPSGSASSEAIDAFWTSRGNHLFPKLRLAIRSTNQFQEFPLHYKAHLSMLFDLFPAEKIGTGMPFYKQDRAPLYGLVQEFATRFQDTTEGAIWKRQPRHGEVYNLPETEGLIDLLAPLSWTMSGATATIATGIPAFLQRPVLTISLGAKERELIHLVHEASDWVFTIDRNIGIEFFDHGGQRDRPDYLIDYVPSTTTSFGHRLVITSRSLTELEAILNPILKDYGLEVGHQYAALILQQLRSLSGRLALKLLSTVNQQAEAIGLALARLFLQDQGALRNQIIVPLDDHIQLFHSAKKQAEELGEVITLQRTDIALFDLNANTRTIRCNLVEVKCHRVGGIGAYNDLKKTIGQQINQSQSVLQRHFDPNWKSQDRPDRLLKTRELVSFLEFYLDRSVRYGLISETVEREALTLLITLEDGYTLEFTRSALIFDFDEPGTEPPDLEDGIEFHRIGIDVIKTLLNDTLSQAPKFAANLTTTSTIPRLSSAAFLVSERDRTTDFITNENGDKPALDNQEEEAISQYNDAVSEQKSDLVQSDEVNQEKILHLSSKKEDMDTPEEQLPILISQKPQEVTAAFDVVLGVQESPPQFGVLGEVSGRKVALDLNQTHTISLFGVQGSGKSYTLGSVVEMASISIPNINVLPSPLATVIFHYSPTQDYKPEFTSMIKPNTDPRQVKLLQERYGVSPQALSDVLLLTPKAQVNQCREEMPDIEVLPITFAASELKSANWKFLMGAVGSQSMYLRQINLIMRRFRENLTLEELRNGINHSALPDRIKDLANTRLDFAAEYIDDQKRLTDVIRPGRLIIVDLRDEFIDKDEALGLFVVLLQLFSEATYQGQLFNKLIVFDEAHKYIESQDLVTGLIEVVREMRHKGTSIMVASQEPRSVPVSLIELSSQIILHKFNSPEWLKHIQRANAALNSLTPEKMSQLGPGEAYVWSSKASDETFTREAIKIRCRPRITQHGGSTKTAVNQEE